MIILSSTYWYPEYYGDIHATYVQDINRHLLLIQKDARVIVITPNYGNSLLRSEMDGVIVERFNFAVPMEFSYGKVAQTKKTALTKIKGILSMGTYILKNLFYTYKYARKYSADVIHAHWAIPSGFPALLAAKLLRKPCFITMHGGDVYYNESEGYIFPKLWYIKPFLRYTLNGAAKLTAITNDCKNHAINAGARPDNIIVITNGADIRRFSPENNTKVPDIQKEYNLEKKKVIFTCRQLIPRKGIRYLIKAMPYILKKHTNVKLLIAGDGMERDSLERLVDDLGLVGNVIFLGWIKNDELPHYYNSSDIMVIPSLEEGFGIPAAEAMGCELPVVSTDAGGLVEVVNHDETGFIVPKADEKALADSIVRLLSNPELARKMGKAGKKRAKEFFSWDMTAENFIILFKKYINQQHV